MTYEQAIAYLGTLAKFGSQPGLDRIEKLLDSMGHPERNYRTIHIAGTNGKGSTSAFLASILQSAGIRTAMFTSPHLLEYTERMIVDGKMVSPDVFGHVIDYTRQHVDEMMAAGEDHPTEFEILTAAAFYYFAIAQVEYAVIEVGLGGLLDSTNVITPEATVITNVTLEHTDRCGTEIAAIAAHKAGIIKKEVPVITAAKCEALNVIYEQAVNMRAPLFTFERDFFVQWKGNKGKQQVITVRSNQYGNVKNLVTTLLGHHQAENCACAVMAAQVLAQQDERITREAIQSGVEATCWPGRFELLGSSPIVLVDGAHNPAGAAMLRETLNEMWVGQPITFIFGVLADKDIEGMGNALFRSCDKVVTVAPLSDRAETAEALAARIVASQVEAAASIEEAIDTAVEWAGVNGIVCICGSLYLIGTARESILHRQTGKFPV